MGNMDDLILVYHDAEYLEAKEVGIYSQLGYVLLITNKEVLRGEHLPGMLVGWKSHACPRVCSTFGRNHGRLGRVGSSGIPSPHGMPIVILSARFLPVSGHDQ